MILRDEKLVRKSQLGFIFAVVKAIGPPTAPICHRTPTNARGAHVLWLRVAPACRLAADTASVEDLIENFHVCFLSSFEQQPNSMMRVCP